jgi:hypothetical protein
MEKGFQVNIIEFVCSDIYDSTYDFVWASVSVELKIVVASEH